MTQNKRAWLVVLGWVIGLTLFAQVLDPPALALPVAPFELVLTEPGIYTVGPYRYVYLPRSWTQGARGYLLRQDPPKALKKAPGSKGDGVG